MSKRIALVLPLLFAGAVYPQVQPRIVANPNGSVVRISGTTHPLTDAATLLGRAPSSLPMERVLLHLASSPEQEVALAQLLADQQDPASQRYHQWLTPEEFGAQFGVAQQDIDSIASWLESQGLQVTEVAAGRRAIEFSGSAAQIETAFQTEIDRYRWNGRAHVANAVDISIPAALSAVVKGVVSLHDFGVRSFHHLVSPTPLTDFSGGMHGLSPYDFAAIYNVAPLWTAGYDGSGQTIAVVGETNIKMTDVAGFRAMWGMAVNNPTVIVNGKDPGIVAAEEMESDLDVEWAGAVAKGATIDFVTSAGTNASDGVTLSAQYIVQHNTAPVMTLSYGLCEAQGGSSNAFYNSLWQQAAAEGIAVFVAAGDSGSAGCDAADSRTPAIGGFGVNGLASTVYNVAVGGTEFSDTGLPSTYWSGTNNSQGGSALGYIPESVWNESSLNGGSGLYATGGGASILWSRPAWQSGTGVPAGTARLLPDVSLTAAGHDGYAVEIEGALYLVGGTSASTPSFAGLMAIVNQYTHASNGNPASKLYALAGSFPSAFHDVTSGSNAVACQGGSPNCSAAAPASNSGILKGYGAAVGFDLATGLGSVDATALVTNWGGTSPSPVIVSLSPNPMTGSSAGQTLTINGAGFAPGAGLVVTVGKATYQGSAVTFVSSSQLKVTINLGVTAQTLPVAVSIPGGGVTASANLTVIAPAAPPAIVSLSPNPMTGSAAAQTLTINGSGFVSGTGLKVTVGGTVYQGSAVTFVSTGQVTVSVTVGISAQTLAVVVTDPNGVASAAANLTVVAPAAPPAIVSLSPNPMTGSAAAQTLTINGSGFVSGTGLKVTVGGTVYQGSAVTFVSTGQVTVSVMVGISAQTLAVVVTNANGVASAAANLTVVAPAAPPAIASLSPNPMTGSAAAQTLTINGSGFVFGTGLKVTVGGTVYQGSAVTFVSTGQVTVSVTVGTSSQTLPVVVTNPNGAASAAANLTVVAPPAIVSLSPNPMTGSAAAQTLTINGSGFVSGTGLKVTVGGMV
ncbi:MAG TPA: protease pro-enzyme activation domain-containing protein, partial [Bryobacteraceae bacterium]|nr:protease pro-enzyme activation domain-containing protein [Bryobacteraceae bacterium]